jgi:hypothetical protein
MACDPYWNSVVLALHMDGANNSTTFTDEKGNTVTPYGNAQISTAASKFGGASAYFDGSGDYLSVSSSSSINLSSGDFTIECWIYLASAPNGQTMLNKDGVSGSSYPSYGATINSSSRLTFTIGSGDGTSSLQAFVGAVTTVAATTWYHVAITKSGTTIRGFLNGVLEFSGTQTATITDGGKALIIGYDVGQPASAYFNGYIDDLRITKGVARYTGNFTPAIAAFDAHQCAISGTVKDASNNFASRLVRVYHRNTGDLIGHALSNPTTGEYSIETTYTDEHFALVHDTNNVDLDWGSVALAMHMDDVGLSDEKGNVVSLYGNAARSATQSKFGGYSAYFDGSGDYLTVPNSADFYLGNDFTVECWFYISGNSVPDADTMRAANLVNTWGNAAAISGWALNILGSTTTTGTGLSFATWNNGVGTIRNATVSIAQGSWNHACVTCSAGVCKMFLNGVSITLTPVNVGAGYALANNFTNNLHIGLTLSPGYPLPLNGYIDDLRITKGVARYTSDFTPPSTPFPEGITGGTENAVIYDRIIPA